MNPVLGVTSETYLSMDKLINYQLQYIRFAYLMKLSTMEREYKQKCTKDKCKRFYNEEV